MFGVLCSGRTSGGAHAGARPSRAKLGEREPREQPKSDLMGKRGSSWGGGAARVKGPSGRFQRLATLRQRPGGLGRSGAVYRGGGPEAIRIKLFSKVPPRRAPTGARPLDQSYGSLAPCGFSRAGSTAAAIAIKFNPDARDEQSHCMPACMPLAKKGEAFSCILGRTSGNATCTCNYFDPSASRPRSYRRRMLQQNDSKLNHSSIRNQIV